MRGGRKEGRRESRVVCGAWFAPGASTLQERFLHGLHEGLEVVLHIVHDDVDLVHVASHHNLLGREGGREGEKA